MGKPSKLTLAIKDVESKILAKGDEIVACETERNSLIDTLNILKGYDEKPVKDNGKALQEPWVDENGNSLEERGVA